MRPNARIILSTALILLVYTVTSAQQPTGLAAVPDKLNIVAERANLSADGLFSLVNFDTLAMRVLSIAFVGNNPLLRIESGDLPLLLEAKQSTQVRVVYTPNGDTTDVADILLAIGDNVITGERDTVAVPVTASIGPYVPPDTIRLRSKRSVGLIPNTIRYLLILDSDLDDDIGFAEATFRYKTDQLYLGDYTVLSDRADLEWRYTGLRIVPDNKRSRGDTIADFHFTILHGTNSGGDTNSVLVLIRLEWFKKFTGNHIYTHTVVDEDVVSDVKEDNPNNRPHLSVSVYPNPADAYANIRVVRACSPSVIPLAKQPLRLSLYSTVGAEVMDLSALVSNAPEAMSFVVDVSSIPRGMYMLRFGMGTVSIVRNLVIR